MFPEHMWKFFTNFNIHVRPVVPGGAGGAVAPPDFGRSVIPYLNQGGQIMPTK